MRRSLSVLAVLLEHAGARGLCCAPLDPEMTALEVQVPPSTRPERHRSCRPPTRPRPRHDAGEGVGVPDGCVLAAWRSIGTATGSQQVSQVLGAWKSGLQLALKPHRSGTSETYRRRVE